MNIATPGQQSQWSTDFGDGDKGRACCITCFLPCVTFGRIAEIVDEGQSSCVGQCFVYWFLMSFQCQWLYACTYRKKLRKKYGLPPEPCNDCCFHYYCGPCALCQEYAELTARGLDPSKGWIGAPNAPPQMPPSMHR